MLPRVLVIDDEPKRADKLMSVCDLRIAHGFEQIKFWLRNTHWRPDLVFLDNDMPLMKGVEVARYFGLDLVGIPVIIWSMNPIAAREIRASLDDIRIPDLAWSVRIKQYDEKTTSDQWQQLVNKFTAKGDNNV